MLQRLTEILNVKSLEQCLGALASVAQLVGALSHNRKVAGLVPAQDTYLGCGFHPQSGSVQSPVWVHLGGNQSMLLSHIDGSLSFPLSLKEMKKCLQMRIQKFF